LVRKDAKQQMTVAQARSDFFNVLHLPVLFTDGITRVPDILPHVVLSQDTWIRNFGRKPNIAGAKLHVGSLEVVVVGVISGDLMFPGRANAWLLGPDPQFGSSKSRISRGPSKPRRVRRRWPLGAVHRRNFAGVPGATFRQPTIHRRVRQLFAKAFTGQKRPLLGIPVREDPDLLGNCFLWFRGFGLLACATLFAIVGLHTSYIFPCTLPYRPDMGLPRPEASMPYLPQTYGTSSSGWAAIADLPCLERDRTGLRAWTCPTSYSRDSHQLVRRAALGLPRRLMAVPFCSTERLAFSGERC
jgi:hypothetical protein